MRDSFGVAAFRSRQRVMWFETALRRLGVPAEVISTPRDIAMGCGLSLRFPLSRTDDVRRALMGSDRQNLIGLYRADYDGARLRLSPL